MTLFQVLQRLLDPNPDKILEAGVGGGGGTGAAGGGARGPEGFLAFFIF